MKKRLHTLFLGLSLVPGLLHANTAPTVVIQSAAMRPGTTLMDVVYRVNDPDNATVKTRALAFVDGVRSFANVLRPVTFAEGTGSNLGDNIPANTDRTITWDVAADWNIQLGQVKFEVLAMDARGLLQFDWISIPAAGGSPALTISKDSPTEAATLNAFFWQYASGDPALSLAGGVVQANASGGIFNGLVLANGTAIHRYGTPYLLKRMNLTATSAGEVTYASTNARAGLLSTSKWHAANRPYAGTQIVFTTGTSAEYQPIPNGISGVTAIAAGQYHSLALTDDGTVTGWGNNYEGELTNAIGQTGVIAISSGDWHSLLLRADGTVVGSGAASWDHGQTRPPNGLTGVIAIAAGGYHSLALKSDGTVVAWGSNGTSQTAVPNGLTGVTAIAAGAYHSLALKSNGTVVGWGYNGDGQIGVGQIPTIGLTGVIAISAGQFHTLLLKSDGTVVGLGSNEAGQTTSPSGLTGVIAIAAGHYHSLALKNDGTVVGWGSNSKGETTIPIKGVTAIAAGANFSLAITDSAE